MIVYSDKLRAVVPQVIIVIWTCLSTGILYGQPGNDEEWTDNKFPSYIKRMNQFGERPDWSHDGKKILFVARSFGDIFEMDVATGIIRPMTHHYYHGGYLRALYLSNGDILLLGPKTFPSDNWQEARFKLTELWVLSKNLDGPPVRLGEFIWEGPAVSRSQLRIAWAQHHGNYPSQKRYWQVWVADIDYSTGKPQIKDQRVVLDNSSGEIKDAVLEPQNFLPGNEDKLTIQSSHNGGEVMLLNLKTGELTNLSDSPASYDEPEGVFPDGQYTLVESSRHMKNESTGKNIDLYKLKLEKDGTWERLTYFNVNGKYKATNPVISDDGKFMAFMVALCEEMAGIGHGIYIFDIEAYQKAKNALKR